MGGTPIAAKWRRLQPVGVGWGRIDLALTNPYKLKPAPLRRPISEG